MDFLARLFFVLVPDRVEGLHLLEEAKAGEVWFRCWHHDKITAAFTKIALFYQVPRQLLESFGKVWRLSFVSFHHVEGLEDLDDLPLPAFLVEVIGLAQSSK